MLKINHMQELHNLHLFLGLLAWLQTGGISKSEAIFKMVFGLSQGNRQGDEENQKGESCNIFALVKYRVLEDQ